MHSHPRRKLPADRFPKLRRRRRRGEERRGGEEEGGEGEEEVSSTGDHNSVPSV